MLTLGAQLLTIKAVILFPWDKVEEFLNSFLRGTVQNLDNYAKHEGVQTHPKI